MSIKRKKPRSKIEDCVLNKNYELVERLGKIIEIKDYKDGISIAYHIKIGDWWYDYVTSIYKLPTNSIRFRGKIYKIDDNIAGIINSIIEYENTVKSIKKLK